MFIMGITGSNIVNCLDVTMYKPKVFGGPGTFFQKGSWPPEASIVLKS